MQQPMRWKTIGKVRPSSIYLSRESMLWSIANGLRDVRITSQSWTYPANHPVVSRKMVPHRRILSKAAKDTIHVALESGKYDDRRKRVEPPYMAPSTEEGDYPSVCSPFTPLSVHGLWHITVVLIVPRSGCHPRPVRWVQGFDLLEEA